MNFSTPAVSLLGHGPFVAFLLGQLETGHHSAVVAVFKGVSSQSEKHCYEEKGIN